MDKEDKKTLFPSIVKSLDDFLYEEEGNITRNKIVAMGTMVLILSLLMMDDAFASGAYDVLSFALLWSCTSNT